MTLRELIDEAIAALTAVHHDEAPYEGRQLVQEALNLSLTQVMSHPDRVVDAAAMEKVKAWTAARLAGQPLAYLSKRRGFYKNDYYVEPGVLVPRPETELVVETALRRADAFEDPVKTIADLGCGSGCIGLSVIGELGTARLSAVDASELACQVTLKNARALGLEDRVSVHNFEIDRWRVNHRFDLIVSNPPYIPDDSLDVEPGVKRFEPALALFGGADGLSCLRNWTAWSFRHLERGGLFVCEFGIGQSDAINEIFFKTGFKQIEVEPDLAGIDRVISAVRAK